jgi:hypothetical protein
MASAGAENRSRLLGIANERLANNTMRSTARNAVRSDISFSTEPLSLGGNRPRLGQWNGHYQAY